jgi:hypothetical protein
MKKILIPLNENPTNQEIETFLSNWITYWGFDIQQHPISSEHFYFIKKDVNPIVVCSCPSLRLAIQKFNAGHQFHPKYFLLFQKINHDNSGRPFKVNEIPLDNLKNYYTELKDLKKENRNHISSIAERNTKIVEGISLALSTIKEKTDDFEDIIFKYDVPFPKTIIEGNTGTFSITSIVRRQRYSLVGNYILKQPDYDDMLNKPPVLSFFVHMSHMKDPEMDISIPMYYDNMNLSVSKIIDYLNKIIRLKRESPTLGM